MQRELLDRRDRGSGVELAAGTFEWIEAWYPRRCHIALGYRSPHDF